MRKNPIFIFTLIILALTLGAVAYIQSAHFAKVVKRISTRYLPKNIGISGDFDHLSVKLLPPGVAIVKPEIFATGKNPAGIPEGTEIKAERLELIFRPFQMLSGRVRVHEVRVIEGSLVTTLQPQEQKKPKAKLSWEEIFQIQADRLTLENTHVKLGLPTQKIAMEFNARRVELEKVQEDERSYYDLFLYVDALQADVPGSWQYPSQLDSLRTSLELDQDGIRLKDLEIVREGTQFLASGSVKGDLLSGKGLRADLKLRLSADLQRMLQFLTKDSTRVELPSGHVSFDGQVKGDLDRPQETIQATGILNGENVGFKNYHFEKVMVEGAYNAKVGENAVQVKRAVLQSALSPKVGGHQPGIGGKVELGAFNFSLDKPEAIQTHLKLENAHIHWLGAIVLKDLYGLDGRISGDAQVQFTPGTATESFQVNADLDWKVADFQLDNQRLNERKPLSRILVIPALGVKGKIRIRKDEIAFLETEATMKKSNLKVGGRIRLLEKTVYELQAGGPVDLSEIKMLAENTIRGVGSMGIQVHGPSDRVLLDFDSDIRDFYFLRLQFGDFRGRITWDDDPNILHFRDLDCNRARTRYRIAGKMNLGDEDTMDFQVQVPTGNIADFIDIFDELTNDFWWFPSRMSGAMKGSMRIHGGVSMDRMKVDAVIDGTGWDFYTERMNQVRLEGGYDRGKYFLSKFDVKKKQGSVRGRVSYDEKQVISWNVSTENVSVTDFDHIARLEIPVRGIILGKSQGSGPPGKVESLTEVQILDTMIRGRKFPASDLVIQASKGVAQLQGQLAGGQGRLEGRYDFTDGGSSYVKAEANALDFTPGILLLNPSLIQDELLQGTLTGKYELRFQTGRSELGSGMGQISEYRLSRAGIQFVLEKPVQFRIDEGSFLISDASIVGPTGKATLSLRSSRGALNGDIRGRADLAVLEFLTPVISQARGHATLGYTIGGTIKKPDITGGSRVREGMVKTPSLESPFENITGRFDLDDGILRVIDLEADLAGGRMLSEGNIEFFMDRFPKLNLDASLSGNKLKVYPFQVAKVRGKLSVKGDSLPYLVSGRVLVESAISREKIASARGPGLRTAQYTPPPRANVVSDYPLFRLNIAVSAPGNVIVQNEILDVEAKGELTIVNTLENPRVIGTAYAVQGKLLFKDRSFVIQSGTMEFDNPTTINPRFEVLANTEISNRKIQLLANGRLDSSSAMRIQFTSNPPMPENEILSLLALGFTSEDAKRLRSTDRSTYEQGEAASLVLHSLDFNREVQNKTGLQIGIDEAVDQQTGQSAFRRSNETDANAAAPKIVIRRRFGDRLDLSVGSTVGVGTSIQREVNAEVKVTRGFSVLGVWDTFEATTSAEESRRSSYGVDLKVQKRFK